MSECYFTHENQWYRMHEFQFFLCQILCQIQADSGCEFFADTFYLQKTEVKI